MKTLRNICAVAILTLTVAVSVSAGQLQFPGVVSGGDTDGAKSAGQIQCPGVVSGDTGGSTSEITTPIILTVTSLVS